MLAQEDMVNKAMALGNIAVLEFAISQGHSYGLDKSNPTLIRNADNKYA